MCIYFKCNKRKLVSHKTFSLFCTRKYFADENSTHSYILILCTYTYIHTLTLCTRLSKQIINLNENKTAIQQQTAKQKRLYCHFIFSFTLFLAAGSLYINDIHNRVHNILI